MARPTIVMRTDRGLPSESSDTTWTLSPIDVWVARMVAMPSATSSAADGRRPSAITWPAGPGRSMTRPNTEALPTFTLT